MILVYVEDWFSVIELYTLRFKDKEGKFSNNENNKEKLGWLV